MKLIIFDIDGTLCDFNKVDDSCFIQAFNETFNIDVTETNWNEYEHVTDTGVTNRIFNEKYKRNSTDGKFQKFIT